MSMRWMRDGWMVFAAVLAAFVWSGSTVAQESADGAEEPGATAQEEDDHRLTTLGGILESITTIDASIAEQENVYRDAETDEQKQSASAEIETLGERRSALENDFTLLATGIDPQSFFESKTEEFDWREELQSIFSPMIAELKSASAYPREVEALKGELRTLEDRVPRVGDAVAALERLRMRNGDSLVGVRLDDLTSFWSEQRDTLTTQLEATRQQLEEKERERVGVGRATGEILRVFFKRRFVNLILAMLAFAGIFLLLRSLHRLVHRRVGAGGSNRRQVLIRLADVVYYLFTVVGAIGALLFVLYLSADWVLLTLAVLVLVGIVWATRNAIPIFFEQAKLLLNVGAVREGERLIYHDVPWRVSSLSFFSDLSNPELRGGNLRLPLADLVGLRSRAGLEDEPWFPTSLGDWVILADGTYGEIVEQTPEVVVVSTVRGSLKHYPTADFVAQFPKNLSRNFFAVRQVVGLDYRYRDVIESEIVPRIKQSLEEGLRREFYGEFLDRVIVELLELGGSSLDIVTIARFRGGAASEYTEIHWKLQQLALRVCNEHGWEIPFPQLTVHRAEESSTPLVPS